MASREGSIARDSAIVAAATLASRLLGFARDVLIARVLGAGPVADAFLVALRLPNLVRRVLGEGGLNAPFVPVYLAAKTAAGPDEARRFAGEAVGWLALALLVLVLLGEVLAPWLVLGLAGGFADEPQTLSFAAFYTRLMLPFLLLTVLAALIGALLNAEGKFGVAAAAPAAMNTLLVAAALGAHGLGADPVQSGRWLAGAVTLTGFVHLALILVAARRLGAIRPSLRVSPWLKRLVSKGGPTLLAASAGQLVLLVSTQIASAELGAVAALYYADRVFQLPLGFVGVAMGTVVLTAVAGADAREQEAALGKGLLAGLALAVPAGLALVLLAEPIASVLFEGGRFGAEDRMRTAGALAAFAPGLAFAVAGKVFGQAYFIRQQPRLPLLAGLAALAAAALVGLLGTGRIEPARLGALAATVAFAVQGGVLALCCWRDGHWRPQPDRFAPLVHILLASLAMTVVLLLVEPHLSAAMAPSQSTAERLAALCALCVAGLGAYGGTAFLLGLHRPLR